MRTINEIAQRLKEQRKSLGIEQKDMYMRIGMKQQQYQRVEAGSDIKLSTLLRILEGLDLELSLAPKGQKYAQIISHQETELKDNGDDFDFWMKEIDGDKL